MVEYINRELLKERFRKRLDWLKKDIHNEYSNALYDGCEYDTNLIDEIPVVDVAPVVHGRWIGKPICGNDNCRCSECGSWHHIHANLRGEVMQKYCPNCGAKMDEPIDESKR